MASTRETGPYDPYNRRLDLEVLIGEEEHARCVPELIKLFHDGGLYVHDLTAATSSSFMGDDVFTLLLRLEGGRVVCAV